jgi:hypothetical protein
MWHPRAHSARPWWRFFRNTALSLERVDGWSVHDTFGGIAVQPPAYARAEKPLVDTSLLDAMAYVDTNHPLPAPDPMPGQVWAFPGSGIERTIVDVTGGAGWFMFQPGAPFSVGGPYSCHARPEMLRIDEWPPPGGVLVSGPTPWGRDVPWAPMEGA